MTGPDPERIVAAITRLADKAAHRATVAALEPDDYDAPELVAAAAAGFDSARRARWHQVIPARFHDADPADIPDVIAGDVAGWARDPHGRNLVLFGPVGVGKTHTAVAAVRAQFFAGAEVRFLPVVELLDLLRPGGPDGALYDLADVDLLVLDDAGTERSTDWTAERLYALINRRWLERAPIVATSNLPATTRTAPDGYTGDTLEGILGPRTFSRLVGSGAVSVRLSGPDLRRTR